MSISRDGNRETRSYSRPEPCARAMFKSLRHPLQAHLHLKGGGCLRIALVGRPLVQLLIRQAEHRQPVPIVQSVSLLRQGLRFCCCVLPSFSDAQECVERG